MVKMIKYGTIVWKLEEKHTFVSLASARLKFIKFKNTPSHNAISHLLVKYLSVLPSKYVRRYYLKGRIHNP